MIPIQRDTEGLRMAFAEIFERDFGLGQIAASLEHASPESRDRLLASLPPLRLSPGYHRAADHLMSLEAEHEVGLPLMGLAGWEAKGLIALKQARTAHQVKHPACGVCGTRQATRLAPECLGCGTKFKRRSK